jgi:ribosomal protein S18 acetylase RimI-like enzyme
MESLNKFTISSAAMGDLEELVRMYRAVAAIEGGIARTLDEVDARYVGHFLAESLASGCSLVARLPNGGEIIGEIHAWTLTPKRFSHVLGELTIAVHPDHQGLGVGRSLFLRLLTEVEQNRPDILRVELIAQESNQRAIGFYESLGFQIEGKMTGRIHGIGDVYEADIPMAWHR